MIQGKIKLWKLLLQSALGAASVCFRGRAGPSKATKPDDVDLKSRLRALYTVEWRHYQSILIMLLYSFPAGLDKLLAWFGLT